MPNVSPKSSLKNGRQPCAACRACPEFLRLYQTSAIDRRRRLLEIDESSSARRVAATWQVASPAACRSRRSVTCFRSRPSRPPDAATTIVRMVMPVRRDRAQERQRAATTATIIRTRRRGRSAPLGRFGHHSCLEQAHLLPERSAWTPRDDDVARTAYETRSASVGRAISIARDATIPVSIDHPHGGLPVGAVTGRGIRWQRGSGRKVDASETVVPRRIAADHQPELTGTCPDRSHRRDLRTTPFRDLRSRQRDEMSRLASRRP